MCRLRQQVVYRSHQAARIQGGLSQSSRIHRFSALHNLSYFNHSFNLVVTNQRRNLYSDYTELRSEYQSFLCLFRKFFKLKIKNTSISPKYIFVFVRSLQTKLLCTIQLSLFVFRNFLHYATYPICPSIFIAAACTAAAVFSPSAKSLSTGRRKI